MKGDSGSGSVSVPVRGGTLNVEIIGSGVPILCLHGLSANLTTWHRVSDRLGGECRLILPDLLGRGRSHPAPGADARYRLADELDRVETLLDTLGVLNPAVVGHSQGAALAIALAVRRQVRGLLLLNPVSPLTHRPAAIRLLDHRAMERVAARAFRLFRRPLTRYILEQRVFASRAHVDGITVDRYAEPYADRGQAAALVRVLADWDPSDLEREVSLAVPCQVVAGGLDRRVNARQARAWAIRLAAGFTLLEDTGHALPEERPDEVAAFVRGLFLDR